MLSQIQREAYRIDGNHHVKVIQIQEKNNASEKSTVPLESVSIKYNLHFNSKIITFGFLYVGVVYRGDNDVCGVTQSLYPTPGKKICLTIAEIVTFW